MSYFCNIVLSLLYLCPQISGVTGMVISLSFGSRVFSTTSLKNPVPDLFGSIFVDDGVEHGRYQDPHPEPPSHHPPHIIPLGHPSAPALSTLYHASNLDNLAFLGEDTNTVH